MKKPTQKDLYYQAERRAAEFNQEMLWMLFGPNPITDEELKKLIEKRPHLYGRFAGFIGVRNNVEDIISTADHG